jgi:hypothetical protein
VVTIFQRYVFFARIAGALTAVDATAAAVPIPAFFKKSRRFIKTSFLRL